MTSFVLTYNPERWDWDSAEPSRGQYVADTAAGRPVEGRWSTGVRTTLLQPGDTGYLFQQGAGPRGIAGSGTFISEIQSGPHWNPERQGSANFAWLRWSHVLPESQLLPIAEVEAVTPGVDWARMQGSGVAMPEADAAALERLWLQHLIDVGRLERKGGGQGRSPSAEDRKAIEDHAQQMLEAHYRARGWEVTDTHAGNPYDAVARKDGQTRYLEAKGTVGHASEVLVTAGEVDFARAHLGEGVIGIVTSIRLIASGTVDPASGTLTCYPWDPDAGRLTSLTYRWSPRASPGAQSP